LFSVKPQLSLVIENQLVTTWTAGTWLPPSLKP
jgi:hypothetical protein